MSRKSGISSTRTRLPNSLFGYSCDPAYGRRANNEGRVVNEIYCLFVNERLSYEAIADRINTDSKFSPVLKRKRMSKVQVYRILRRPEYCGMEQDSHGGYKASENFDLIVKPRIWIQAQVLLARKTDDHKNVQSRLAHPLSGIIKCADCHQCYYSTKDMYYAHKHLGKNKSDCDNPNTYIAKSDIESYLLELLLAYCTERKFRDDLFDLLWREQAERYSYIPDLVDVKARIETFAKYLSVTSKGQDADIAQVCMERLMHFFSELSDLEMNIVAEYTSLFCTTFRQKPISRPHRLGYIERLVTSIEVGHARITTSLRTGTQFYVLTGLISDAAEMIRLPETHSSPSIEDLESSYRRWLKKKTALAESEIDDHGFRQFLYEIQMEHIANGRNGATKMMLYSATLRNAKKPYDRFYLSSTYQWNGEGDYYIDTGKASCVVTVHHASGKVIAVEVLGDLYIEEEILHSVNVETDNLHPAYFDLQGRKIMFTMNKRAIKAYDYSALRKGGELQIMSALADIELCPTAVFVDERTSPRLTSSAW